MPELPDIEVYLEALRTRIQGQPLEAVRLGSPFLLRTVEPPLASLPGRRVTSCGVSANASSSVSRASCSRCCT